MTKGPIYYNCTLCGSLLLPPPTWERGIRYMRDDLRKLAGIFAFGGERAEHAALSKVGTIVGVVRKMRAYGNGAQRAAAERAHAELVQALHATIRAAEPAGGAR